MPLLTTDDGVKLHYEEVGAGTPIVFVHEFAGDCRSWEQQMRYFGRRYRCIAFNARGYPPSDVPDDVEMYSQERARDDIKAVLDALEDRQGAYRRPVDGRLRDAALRLHLSRSRAFAGRRRLRLWRLRRQAGAVRRRGRSGGGAVRTDRHGQGRRGLCVGTVARAVPEQGPARLARVRRPTRRPTRRAARR